MDIAMKKIIYLFLIWRILLFVVVYLAPFFLHSNFGKSFPYWQERLIGSGLPHFIWSFGNFDGVHYLGIAKDAYSAQFTQAFFPLYPILVKIVSFVTFGNFVVAGLLVSNLAFLAALILFYKLIAKTHSEKIALWSTLFLLAFPTSFYFGAIYTEGLFFLMIVAAFYLAEQKKFWQAAIVGSLASSTRLIGLFLTPFIVSWKNLKSALPALIVPIGFLTYVLYLKIQFNNPFYFLWAQSIFGQERSVGSIILLPQVIYRYLKILSTVAGQPFINAVLELSSTIIALTLLIFAIRIVKLPWILFGFAAIIIPTLTGTFASMPRYILVAFPIYIALAQIKSTSLKVTLLIISLSLLVYLTALFTQGYWVA